MNNTERILSMYKSKRKSAPPISEETRDKMKAAASRRWKGYSPTMKKRMFVAMNAGRWDDNK